MEPGNMFNEDCKGCRLDEATHWDKKCPYRTNILDDTLTLCYCCEEHVEMCEEAVRGNTSSVQE